MNSKENLKKIIEEYCETHKDEIIQNMVEIEGFNSLKDLREFEYNCGYGFDCGWIKLYPRDNETYNDWIEKDTEHHSPYIYFYGPYNTQSTTLMKIQAKYVLEKLGLDSQLVITVVLD